MRNTYFTSFILLLIVISNSCSNNSVVNKELFKDTIIQGFHGTVYNDTVWMKDFLDIDTFNNGDPIPTANNADEWKKACLDKKPIKAYADFDKNKHAIYNLYSLLDSRHIAPRGWQIPNDQDIGRLFQVFQKFDRKKNNNVVKDLNRLPNYYLINPKKWKHNWFPDDSLHYGYSSYLNLAPTKYINEYVVSFSGATEFLFYPENKANDESRFWWFNENKGNVGFFILFSNRQSRELKKEEVYNVNDGFSMGLAIKCVSRK